MSLPGNLCKQFGPRSGQTFCSHIFWGPDCLILKRLLQAEVEPIYFNFALKHLHDIVIC